MKKARITTMDEFRAGKQAILRKYGDAIMMGTELETKAILADIVELARFAKLPPERLLKALASQYANGLQ